MDKILLEKICGLTQHLQLGPVFHLSLVVVERSANPRRGYEILRIGRMPSLRIDRLMSRRLLVKVSSTERSDCQLEAQSLRWEEGFGRSSLIDWTWNSFGVTISTKQCSFLSPTLLSGDTKADALLHILRAI